MFGVHALLDLAQSCELPLLDRAQVNPGRSFAFLDIQVPAHVRVKCTYLRDDVAKEHKCKRGEDRRRPTKNRRLRSTIIPQLTRSVRGYDLCHINEL